MAAKPKKNPAAVALGKLGGCPSNLKAWRESLTPEQRSEHAKRSIAKRWSRNKKKAQKKTKKAA